MRVRLLCHTGIAVTTALGTVIGLTSPSMAQTQQTRQLTVVQEMAPVGLAGGQTLRYTWANRAAESQQEWAPLRVTVRLLANDGSVLAQESAPAVGAGRFQVFDFSRAAIGGAGDAATARLQVRVEATVLALGTAPGTLQPGNAPFDDGVEIIDEATGSTTVAVGRGSNELTLEDTAGKEKASRDGFQIISAGRDALLGIVPGQHLRITAVNPASESGADRRFKPLFAFTVLNADGETIVEAAPVTLEPGQSHSVDIPYPALGLSSGRAQVRTEPRYFHGVISRISAGGGGLAPVVLEIVDTASGRTVVHLSRKPKEIVVVGSPIK